MVAIGDIDFESGRGGLIHDNVSFFKNHIHVLILI